MTAPYILTRSAAADLNEVVRYTLQKWGKAQCQNFPVGSGLQIFVAHVPGPRKNRGELGNESWREIVIKQKLHAAGRVVDSLRSLSAANFRHA